MTDNWDDKFGLMELTYDGPRPSIEGVGKDAPTETNKDGGKQSTTQYAMHLLDPDFLDAMVAEEGPLHYIANFMRDNSISTDLFLALEEALDLPTIEFSRAKAYSRLLTIGKVLKEGAEKYEANNWRLIPQESHLNHAIIHYIAYVLGDDSDDHLAHFATRLMMAYATKPTPGFYYNRYNKIDVSEIVKECKD